MPRTHYDYTPSSHYIIEDYMPENSRGEYLALEGSYKTMLGCAESVAIASGKPFLGRQVRQGSVVIVDNETPVESLEYNLTRFAMGMGFGTYKELPIYIYPKDGISTPFMFGNKEETDKLMEYISKYEPVLIRFDSMAAMVSDDKRNSMGENALKLGRALNTELKYIMTAGAKYCSTILNTHSRKASADWTIQEAQDADTVSHLRGHGAIVGLGSDTCYIIKKISEHPKPSRFAIFVRVRRLPIADNELYVELEESTYGEGPITLTEFDKQAVPPTQPEKDIYQYLENPPRNKTQTTFYLKELIKELMFPHKKDAFVAIDSLLAHKALIRTVNSQEFSLNPNRSSETNPEYLAELKKI